MYSPCADRLCYYKTTKCAISNFHIIMEEKGRGIERELYSIGIWEYFGAASVD